MSHRAAGRWGRILGPFLLALAATPAAHASAGGPPLTDTWLGLPRWLWLTFNLIIFWGALIYYAGPPLRRFLTQRSERISTELDEARQQRVEAEQMASTLEGKLDQLRAEMDELIERGAASAERERQEILERAELDKERLLEQTRDEITHRVAVAKQELRRDAAHLAAKLATDRLSAELGPEDRRRLFDESLVRFDRESAS